MTLVGCSDTKTSRDDNDSNDRRNEVESSLDNDEAGTGETESQKPEVEEIVKKTAKASYITMENGKYYETIYDIEYNANIVNYTTVQLGTSMNSWNDCIIFAGDDADKNAETGDYLYYTIIEDNGDSKAIVEKAKNNVYASSRTTLTEGQITVAGYEGYFIEEDRVYMENPYKTCYMAIEIEDGVFFSIRGSLNYIQSKDMTSQEFFEAAVLSATYVAKEERDSWK